ncbi:MAG: RNA-binding protein [Chloroflexi bacterium]|nr:RNA-binding protein [Chloroflexota bacterium]MCH2306675.1 KH domain-containing protein [SAR202 cluster bacterium]|tara:strand:+ start:114 stop:341 length:228 start_codon:yes stop_codon:yes gene_type:complete
MKELIEFIAKSIASQPEMVVVTEEEEEDQIRLILEVADEDKGKVIGREGRVAQSMRTLLRVVAVKQGYRVTLEIK